MFLSAAMAVSSQLNEVKAPPLLNQSQLSTLFVGPDLFWPRRKEMVKGQRASVARRAWTIRQPTPAYDKVFLQDAIQGWIKRQGTKTALDFGDYDWMPVQNAVRGSALVMLSPFIQTLLQVSAAGSFIYSDLKEIFGICAHKYKELVPERESVDKGYEFLFCVR